MTPHGRNSELVPAPLLMHGIRLGQSFQYYFFCPCIHSILSAFCELADTVLSTRHTYCMHSPCPDELVVHLGSLFLHP